MRGLPNDSDQLKVLWKKELPFQPDAVQLLISDLKNEFKKPPPINLTLVNADFDPGRIKTVDDLVTAILEMP